MELILIRHAQPLAQQTNDGTPANPQLSAAGVEQSRAVARWLERKPLHRVISSPALRAMQTAEATASLFDLNIEVDERLRDANPQPTRYVPLEDVRLRDPEAYRERIKAYRHRPELAAVSDRVNQALSEWAARHAGERVVAFCHGSIVNVFAARILGLMENVFLDADYASGHRFMISRTGIRSVKSLNETGYL
jgi:probable phosphoglycerate mutase